ncbi:uncharacterized protein [Asterias amurensis]|uniref:uncharacterized protein isoform X2 n=1 Tax=Asterias amurensis TaxID=7602 RepID=UPI003AB284BF
MATCSFTVEVRQLPDTEEPVLVGCPTQITREIPVGASAISITWPTPTVTDNSLASIVPQVSPRGQGSFNAGTTFITYTATDAAGNEGSCSFPVIVTQTADQVPPTLLNCPTGTLSGAVPFLSTIVDVTWTVPTAIDISGVTPDITVSPRGPGLFAVGTTTIVYTATDGSGNMATCSFTVEVRQLPDTEEPVLVGCPTQITREIPVGASAISITWPTPTVTDNSLASIVPQVSPRGQGSFNAGTTFITYTATDAAGNEGSCSFPVIVTQTADQVPPTLLNCPTGTLSGAVPFLSTIVDVTWTVPTAIDISGVTPDITVSPRGPGLFAVGTTTIVYTATDGSGNMATCSFTVEVRQLPDTEEPVLVGCPTQITREIPVGASAISITWPTPTVTDNSLASIVPQVSPRGQGSFNAGTTFITYTATDAAGNEGSCSFPVIVTQTADQVPPTLLNCPTGTLSGAVPFLSTIVDVTWTVPTAIDISGVTPDITVSPRGPGLFAVGTTTIVYTATDGSGNMATCSFTVEVRQLPDTEEPVLVGCPTQITREIPVGASAISITWPTPTVTDNSLASIVPQVSPRGQGSFNAGTTFITYTATDAAGNEGSCSFPVIVTQTADQVPPTLLNCPTGTLSGAVPFLSTIVDVTWTVPTAIDISGVTPDITVSPRGPGLFAVGTTTIVYTATDGSGNMATCSFTVEVRQLPDTEEPVLVGCPTQITREIPVGASAISITWPTPTVTDNSLASIVPQVSPRGQGSFNAGTTFITYTATDAAGNEGSCSFPVIVTQTADQVPPTLLNCPTGTLSGAVPFLSTIVDVTWTVPTAIDISGVTPDITVSPRGPGLFAVGTTTIVYTATDGSGNMATCSFTVEVRQLPDTEEPVLVGCPTQITREIPVGASAISITWPTPTVTDNSLASIVPQVSPRGQGSFNAGTTFITYTATDAAGNEGSCSFPVIVTQTADQVPPTLLNCPTGTLSGAVPFLSTIVDVTWTVPTAIDISGVTPDITVSPRGPGLFAVGTTTIVYTATDGSGNMATCSFTVEVRQLPDTEEPVLVGCPTQITREIPVGASAISITWPTPTVTDNSLASIVPQVSPRGQGSFNAGTTFITYTATDAAGNEGSCSFPVIVTQTADQVPPTLLNCPTGTLSGAVPFLSTIVDVTWTVPTAIDISGVTPDITVSPRGPGLFAVGTTTIVYTATDGSGNMATCSFTVEVRQLPDTEEPVLVGCPTQITREIPVGASAISITWPTPTVTDNSLASIVPQVSPRGQGSFNAGTTFITYTATDAAGNEGSCSFPVIVTQTADQVPPTLLNCPTGTLSGAVPFLSTIVDVTWTVPTAIDISGVTPDITVSPRGPGLFAVGTTTIVYTATDGSGNMATCSFTVEVRQLPDTEEPVLVGCPTQITREIPVGASAISITWPTPTVTDNSLASIVPQVSPRGQGSFNAGTTFITYTATDAAGNEGSCSFPVIVTQTADQVPPTLLNCPTGTLSGAVPFLSTIVDVTWTVPTAIDISGVTPDITVSPRGPGPFTVGTTTIVYTATDGSGNMATCSFTVEVRQLPDTEEPVLVGCPTQITREIPVGASAISITWTTPTVTDNSLASIVPQVSPRGQGSFNAGTTFITYTATDAAGNEGSCSFPVIVTQTVSASPTTPPQAINLGVIVGVVVGVILLIFIVALVYTLRRRLQCHLELEVTRKSSPQTNRSDRNKTDADEQPVYQDVTEMVTINSEQDSTAYANIPNAQKAFPRNKLRIMRELGHGNFGKVLLAQAEGILERSKVTMVAVKTLKDGVPATEKGGLVSELELMKKLPEHCHVVKLLGYCIEEDPPYIIVEYLSRGNLKDLLKDSRSKEGRVVYGNLHGVSKSLTSRDLMKFASNVADGMTFISSQQCIHRDLAARNILVAEDMTCKVSDFGLARDVMNIRVYERQSDGCLPLRWMAMESVLDDVYTTKSDVWSYGILLWEIVTLGARPYPAMSAKTMIKELQNGYRMPKPSHCQEELYQVMQKCWKEDPAVRPAFKMISQELKKLENAGKDCISVEVYKEGVYEVTIPDDQSEKV